MWIGILLGIYFRLKGLTVWPFATDEFYLAHSVQQILEHGLPKFDCDGSIYNRGILQQYLSALLQLVGFGEVFSMRIVPSLCSLGVLPAAYYLSRRTTDSIPVACITVIILSLSLWEIELARYVRMYSPFQLLFVWYLVFLYKYTLHKDCSSKWMMYFLSILSIFAWEGGIFLLLLNFLPLLFHREKSDSLHYLISSFLLIAGYSYFKIEFRFISGIDPYPADVEVAAFENSLIFPKLLLLSASQNIYWLSAALAIAVCSVYWCYHLFTRRHFGLWQSAGLSALIVLSWLNQLGALLVLAVLMLVAGWFSLDNIKRDTALLKSIMIMVLNLIFWFFYAMIDNVWIAQLGFSDDRSIIKTFLKVLIKFPNILDRIVYPFWMAVPIQAGLLGFATMSVILFSILKRENRNGNLSFLVATLIASCFLVGLVNSQYIETRYFFFLYPLLILVVTTGVQKILKCFLKKKFSLLIYGLTVVSAFVVSEDFNIHHLTNIDSKRVNYRLNYLEHDRFYLAKHFMLRRDYKSPSEYINMHSSEDDIIVSRLPQVYHYLDRLDYSYLPFFYTEFKAASCDGGTRHRWTNKPLIYQESSLRQLIENAEGNVWIVLSRHTSDLLADPTFSEKVVMQGDDGDCCVVLFRKKMSL